MLEIKNIVKCYAKDKILKNINLTISDGEFVAIVGQSGSGKTTLMNIIGGLTVPSEGEVLHNHKNVYNSKHLNNYRRDTIGFVFQDFYLEEHETVAENIEMPMMFAKVNILKRKKRIKEVLKKVELEDKINAKVCTLSGGEKQRVAIARALVNNPKIILADEPTGNLDAKNSEEVISLLKKLTTLNYTVVLVTHDKMQSYQADRIYEMKLGSLKEISCELKPQSLETKEDLINYLNELNDTDLELILNSINNVITNNQVKPSNELVLEEEFKEKLLGDILKEECLITKEEDVLKEDTVEPEIKNEEIKKDGEENVSN